MFRKLLGTIISFTVIASLAACTPANTNINADKTLAVPTESKAASGEVKKSKVESIVIAYLPNESKEELGEHRQGLAKDMEAALGVKVEEFLASDYNAAIEAMRTGKADLAYYGPLSYTQAHDRAKAECIVAPALNGKKEDSGYYSYILTKANNDKINSIEDLMGKKFAFVDANSTSGNLIPSFEILKAIKDDKLTIDDLHTNGKFFESVSFSGAHQNGLQAVIKGDIDAVPCASDVFERELVAKRFNETDIKIIFKSPKIPESTMAIRGDLPDDFKKSVRDFFLKYDNDDYFIKIIGQKAGEKKRFVPAEDSDYKDIYDLRKKFGM